VCWRCCWRSSVCGTTANTASPLTCVLTLTVAPTLLSPSHPHADTFPHPSTAASAGLRTAATGVRATASAAARVRTAASAARLRTAAAGVRATASAAARLRTSAAGVRTSAAAAAGATETSLPPRARVSCLLRTLHPAVAAPFAEWSSADCPQAYAPQQSQQQPAYAPVALTQTPNVAMAPQQAYAPQIAYNAPQQVDWIPPQRTHTTLRRELSGCDLWVSMKAHKNLHVA
jgi:hypothetical protein